MSIKPKSLILSSPHSFVNAFSIKVYTFEVNLQKNRLPFTARTQATTSNLNKNFNLWVNFITFKITVFYTF